MNRNSSNYKLFDENLKIKSEHIASICSSCRKYGHLCQGRKTYEGTEIEFCPKREKIKK